MSCVAQVSIAAATDCWAGFMAAHPAVQTHARIWFRGLRAELREEAVAAACIAYQRLAARGRLAVAYPAALAAYAVNHVRGGRHTGGRQDGARDVMSAVAHRRHGVMLETLHRGGGRHELTSPCRKDSIPELAAFRIDFAAWPGTLGDRDRLLIAARTEGERPCEIAERFGISNGRVSQLRREYERRWRAFQSESIDPETQAERGDREELQRGAA